jgi:hypothetical protein
MADKDYSKSKYYVAPATPTPTPTPATPTPSVQKVGKIPVPRIGGSKYSTSNPTIAPISQKPAPRNFD